MTDHTTIRGFTSTDILRMIQLGNDGPRIAETNYRNPPLARQGLCYLSGNASHLPLPLPGGMIEAVQRFQSVRRALIEPSIQIAGNFELAADDTTQATHCIAVAKAMIDEKIMRINCRILLYAEMGLVSSLPAKIRP